MPLPLRARFYILAAFWLAILTGVVYRLLSTQRARQPDSLIVRTSEGGLGSDPKAKRIVALCNPPETIVSGEEGIEASERWTLKGLLVLIRHGDRGPLQHIKNVGEIDCGASQDNEVLGGYKAYLHNLTAWSGPGSFRGFPLLPPHEKNCQLGQLTMNGVDQLLRLGKVLRKTYTSIWPRLHNLSQYEVSVYSTRYHRTFQSALAFLYGFLNPEMLARIAFVESQSMYFCFEHCGCPVTEAFEKRVGRDVAEKLRAHPAIAELSDEIARKVFDYPRSERDPFTVKDALLTYVCHGYQLPGVKRRDVFGIFAYTDWVGRQKWKNYNWKKLSLLRSYGLIRHIVSQMLAMFSGPHFVLYSGHDRTLERLSAALGLRADAASQRFGGRLVFEVYKEEGAAPGPGGGGGAAALRFRLLADGRDVTRRAAFCRSAAAAAGGAYLCRIEDIVRFLHDDYFAAFNVSSIQDACARKGDAPGRG